MRIKNSKYKKLKTIDNESQHDRGRILISKQSLHN